MKQPPAAGGRPGEKLLHRHTVLVARLKLSVWSRCIWFPLILPVFGLYFHWNDHIHLFNRLSTNCILKNAFQMFILGLRIETSRGC